VGFRAGDQIAFSGLTVASDQVAGNVVTLFDAGHAELGTLTFQTGKGGADNAGAAAAAAQIACFVEGTLIETLEGPVAVENLRVGDEVVTLLGGPGRIIWIGQRAVDCTRHPQPETVWPVRIDRGAFGESVPIRELFVSPDHAIYVDGVLVPASLLINGSSIVQVRRDRVTYYHVELPEHAVILAEGLTVESYLDLGDRVNFDGGSTIQLFPDFAAPRAAKTAPVWEARGVVKLVITGPELEAARQVVRENARNSLRRHRLSRYPHADQRDNRRRR
jgi:hypothetical protein